MKKFSLFILALAAFSPLFGQQPAPQPATPAAPAPQEVVVKIQQQQLPPPQTVAQKANEWVEFGKNVGSAMDAGLTSLTDHADKFSKTDAGRFTMAVIAWKVAGRDALDVTRYVTDTVVHTVVGVGMLAVWIPLGVWFFRRNFMTHRVVIEQSGTFWNRTKKYRLVNDDMSDARSTSAWFFGIIYLIVIWAIIGAVIL